MTRSQIQILAAFFLAAAVANAWLVNTAGRWRELYPMTSFQMFSGSARERGEVFQFEIAPAPEAAPVLVDACAMFNAIVPVTPVLTRRILEGLTKSHDYGCPDYRLSGYRGCKENPVRPWVIPADLAEFMARCAMVKLGLDSPPHLIRLVHVEYPLNAGGLATNLEGAARRDVFTWRPGSGGYQVDDSP